MAKKRKAIKDKKSGIPKVYLSGLKGAKRSKRASLIKKVANLYKSGKRIPLRLLKARTKA
tara:strand:+ start:38 stop:217 length:180 start_codon:yes stop_codon:yes gene_type:complete